MFLRRLKFNSHTLPARSCMCICRVWLKNRVCKKRRTKHDERRLLTEKRPTMYELLHTRTRGETRPQAKIRVWRQQQQQSQSNKNANEKYSFGNMAYNSHHQHKLARERCSPVSLYECCVFFNKIRFSSSLNHWFSIDTRTYVNRCVEQARDSVVVVRFRRIPKHIAKLW